MNPHGPGAVQPHLQLEQTLGYGRIHTSHAGQRGPLQLMAAVDTRFLLIVNAVGIARPIVQPRREPVGPFLRFGDVVFFRQGDGSEELFEARLIEFVQMAVGRIVAAAVKASGTADTRILAVGDSQNDFVARHAEDFPRSGSHVRDVFQHFGAEHAIKRIIRELEMFDISLHADDAIHGPGRLLQIQSRNGFKMVPQHAGHETVAGADFQHCFAAAGQDPHGDAKSLDVLAVLQKFPGIRPDPEAFVEALDPLQPRLYSISSSPKVDASRVSLTVDAVRYRVAGRTRLGVASTFLAGRIAPGYRADLVTLDLTSPRLETAEAATMLESIVFAATAADVRC